MKNLLIGLSVLIVLLLSGCASSSSPAPKVNSNTVNNTENQKKLEQCMTAKDIEKINRGSLKQITKIKGEKNAKLFLALDPSLSAPELRDKPYRDKHFIVAMKRLRKSLLSAGIDEIIIWKLPVLRGQLGTAVPFKNGCQISDYGEPDHLEKLILMHETLLLISKHDLDDPSVRDHIKKLLMVSRFQYNYEDEMIDKFINNIRSLITKY